MGRYKTLLSNTLIFTISQFSSKLLIFFMLPVYTRAMTTGEFGASDLINSSVGLLIPLFTLSIADGALRFAMSSDADNKQVFSFGLKTIFAGFIILILAFPIFLKISIIKDYLLLFYLTYITSTLQNYLNKFARGINIIKLVGICGVLSTIVVVISNILLLLVFNLGVKGYLVSFILANIISSVVLFIGGGMHRYLSVKHSQEQLKKNMLRFSIPLAPNHLSWWLNDTANRYIIVAFCGVSQVGLFAAASRIPAILITLQGIFYQAWLLSAISEYKNEDKDKFFSEVYKLYNLVMLLGCTVLIALVRVIAGILFSGEFYGAWQYIPYLLIAVIFGALSGFFGSIYSASKQNNMLFVTTLVGSIVSVGINFLLVPYYGPMGASAASVVAYIVIWLLRLIDCRKYIKLKISLVTDCFCYVLIIAQALAVLYLPIMWGYICSTLVFGMILLLNKKDLLNLYGMAKYFIKIKMEANNTA